MPFADLNGTEIYFCQSGRGKPCLVMHGGLGFDHSYLSPGLDVLGEILHLIYYDHRCNGRSGRPPIETLTFPQLCDDADALRASLGFERIAVLGHSFSGGAVALEYALRYPERTSHLILVCAAPRFDPADPAFADRLARKGMTAEMAEAFGHVGESDASFRRYTEMAGPLYFHSFDEARYLRQISGILYGAAALARSFEIASGWDVLPRLAAISIPTLLIAGGGDAIIPPGESVVLQRGIAAAELVVLEHSGHFPWMEQAHEFAAAIKGWIMNVENQTSPI